MTTLIQRAEQASTPEEALAVFVDYREVLGSDAPAEFWFHLDEAEAQHARLLRLGYLLLAAMALVPEGWQWNLSNRCPAPYGGRAYINNGELHTAGVGSRPNLKYRGFETVAHFPACALLAAILKARQS